MSRYRIPTRVAPSPAAEEPGQQNAAARIRSSREAQSRLLAERRGELETGLAMQAGAEQRSAAVPAEPSGNPGKREGEVGEVRPLAATAAPAAKPAKIKLAILYRLPLVVEPDLAAIASRNGVTMEYALQALARKARAELRGLNGDSDVAGLTVEALAVAKVTEGMKVIGDPMTVYVTEGAIEAMHRAWRDPWYSIPRATIAACYFTTIVTRLIKARRAGCASHMQSVRRQCQTLLAGEVGQGCRFEAQAVLSRDYSERAALAQDLDHLSPFSRISLGLRSAAVCDGEACLFAGLRQKHHRGGLLVLGQRHDHRTVRSRSENTVRIADDPHGALTLREAQNRQATLRGGHPAIEREGRTGNRNQRHCAKSGRQNMHLQGTLLNLAQRHRITTISADRYVLARGLSTAARRDFCGRPDHAR